MANKGIQGVIVPAVTPLLDGGGLDRDGLRRLVDRLATAGVHGAMVAGTTGEAMALSREVRSDLIREAAAASREAGMVSVAGIGASCLEDILHFARVASDAGASFLSLHPPPYFPVAGDALEGVYRAALERPTCRRCSTPSRPSRATCCPWTWSSALPRSPASSA